MKHAMLFFATLCSLSLTMAESSPCSDGPSTIVKIQMVREDGTIQTPDGKILSKDYSDVIEMRPEKTSRRLI